MTFDELKNEVTLATGKKPKHIRLGQFIFNYIDAVYGTARYVQFVDRVDCFYDNEQIDEFIKCNVEIINKLQKNAILN